MFLQLLTRCVFSLAMGDPTPQSISLDGDEDEPNRDISAAAGLCFPPHYPHRVSPQHKNQEFSPFLQRDNLLLIFITMPSYRYIWVIVG